MATLPGATQSLSTTSGAGATGADYCVIVSPVGTAADETPRVYSNPAAIYTKHGYSAGLRYAALHLAETKKPVIFIGVPIETAGTNGRFDVSGNTNTSVVSVTGSPLCEVDGIVDVVVGGVIGTDLIVLSISCDGGRRYKTVRLGTANSYVIPYLGLTLHFAAGSLTAGQTVLTWHSSEPLMDADGIQDAVDAMAASTKIARSFVVIGDLKLKQNASDVLTAINGYETADSRFVQAQCQLRDRLPYATLSHSIVRMTEASTDTVTFLEVGGTGDTITRSAGSFVTDGFHNNGWIRITASTLNNVQGVVPTVATSVLTLGTLDLANEGPVSGVAITCETTISFVDGGSGADTITRSAGSWLADGFAAGDVITVTGSASNNKDFTVVTVTASTITLATAQVVAEIIGAGSITMIAGESKSDWIATLDGLFTTVDDEPRINLFAGRAWKLDPITGWEHPCPGAWADSIRSYQHDYHIATWAKALGPVSGWDLNDAEGNLVQFDERVDGGALAARFSCFRTWGNGPAGTFIAMSLTRAVDDSVLQLECNMRVANLLLTVNQSATEMTVGQDLILKADGTATSQSLSKMQESIQKELVNAIAPHGEGQRASLVQITLATDDILNVASATLHATMNVTMNGKVHTFATAVVVNQG